MIYYISKKQKYFERYNVSEYKVHPKNPYYYSQDTLLFSKTDDRLVAYPQAKSDQYVSINVSIIGERAFEDCKNILQLNITCLEAHKRAFKGCENLLVCNIHNAIKIDFEAFQGCYNLYSITLPNTLKHIGYRAFYECTSLKIIELPSKVLLANQVFHTCYNLENINVLPDNPYYYSKKGILYERKSNKVLFCPFKNSFTGIIYTSSTIKIDDIEKTFNMLPKALLKTLFNEYKIIFTSESIPNFYSQANYNASGFFCRESHTIYIDCYSNIPVVLLHEIGHYFKTKYGTKEIESIYINHGKYESDIYSEYFRKNTEEYFAQSFAYYFLNRSLLNRHICQYIYNTLQSINKGL